VFFITALKDDSLKEGLKCISSVSRGRVIWKNTDQNETWANLL